MIELTVGCAIVILDGYINIDLHCDQADAIYDVRNPLQYKDKSVDEILASHLLEHFNYRELPIVLANFRKVLKDDGILHVRVPNMLMLLPKLEEI